MITPDQNPKAQGWAESTVKPTVASSMHSADPIKYHAIRLLVMQKEAHGAKIDMESFQQVIRDAVVASTKSHVVRIKDLERSLSSCEAAISFVVSEEAEKDILCADGFTMSYHKGSALHKQLLQALNDAGATLAGF